MSRHRNPYHTASPLCSKVWERSISSGVKIQMTNLKTNFTRKFGRVCAGAIASAMMFIAVPSTTLAQSADEVTLRFANGQDSISGLLTDFKEDRFFLEASIGLVVIPADGASCIGATCPEGTRLVIENGSVVLTSLDGGVTLSGDVIDASGDEFLLATAFGEQRIAKELVTCSGEGCPVGVDLTELDRSVRLTGGGVTLKGELVDFDEGVFTVVDSVIGEVRVKAENFNCLGFACP